MQLCHAPTRLKTTFTRSVRTHIIKQRSAATLPAADLQWIQMAHRAHTLAAWASQPDPQSSPLLLLHRHLAEAAACCCSTQHVAAAKVPDVYDTPAAAADAAAADADAAAADADAADAVDDAAAEGPGSLRVGGDWLLESAEVGQTVKWICSGFAALPAASDRLAYI